MLACKHDTTLRTGAYDTRTTDTRARWREAERLQCIQTYMKHSSRCCARQTQRVTPPPLPLHCSLPQTRGGGSTKAITSHLLLPPPSPPKRSTNSRGLGKEVLEGDPSLQAPLYSPVRLPKVASRLTRLRPPHRYSASPNAPNRKLQRHRIPQSVLTDTPHSQ